MKPSLETIEAYLGPIRAYLAQDGGDIDLVRLSEDGHTLYVRLKGACEACELHPSTLQLGVLTPLQRIFPTLRAIEVIKE